MRVNSVEAAMKEGSLDFEYGGGEASWKERYEAFMAEEEVGLLRNDFRIIKDFLGELDGGMKDWNKFTDSEKQKIYYKQEEGMDGITVYLEAVVNAPLIHMFAILGEVQLFKSFIPLMK